MKGERNSTIAEKFLAATPPAEMAQKHAQALADRERVRREMKDRPDAQRR